MFGITLDQTKLSRVLTVAVFFALIRCISEIIHIIYYTPVSHITIEMFVLGALITAVSLFAMTILSFYKKHTLISIMAGITIIALLLLKFVWVG